MTLPCPVTEQWERMLADELPREQVELLDKHLTHCSGCRERLEQLTQPDTMERVGAILHAMSQQVRLPAEVKHKLLNVITSEHANHETDREPISLPNITGYELISVLGRGGSSVVYAARDTKLHRMVAIKLLHDKATPVQRQRFHKEAQSLASLQHPNVARIFDVGETAEQPYLILEYISGGSLANYLRGQSQAAEPSARVILQLASAIQKAHDTGFIHRDLKPANILLEPHFGVAETSGLDCFLPKIIDFGIARDVQATEHLTNTRDFLGTPSYMAPEQITQSGHWPADQRMDVYALGIILYEMLTGRPPFRAVSPIDTMLQIKHDEPVPPTRFEPTLPRDLQNICLKCIEKDPTKRYSSAQALADDLDHFLHGKPVQARPISRLVRAWRWSKRNPGWASAAALVFLILLVAAFVGPVLAHRERKLREEAAHHAYRAEMESQRAQENLNTAGQVLDEMLDRLLNNMRLQDPAYEDVQKGMVTFAIPYLEQFVQHEEASDVLKLRQARGLMQLAMVQVKNSELDKAQSTYLRSLQLVKQLKPSGSLSEANLLKALSSAHMEYARFLQVYRHDHADSEGLYRISLEYTDQLAKLRGMEKCFDSYAIQYSLLASLLSSSKDRSDEELRYLMQAINYREKLVELYPDRDDLRHYAAMTHMNAAIHYRRQKNADLEIIELRKALDLQLQVNQSKSIWIESPYYVSTLQGELGVAQIMAGQREAGLALVRQARELSQALTIAYPSSSKYQALSQNWDKVIRHYGK